MASNYHIEVNPSDVGIYDRVVIQELIKTVASTQQLDSAGQREFKGNVLTYRNIVGTMAPDMSQLSLHCQGLSIIP